MAIAPYQGISPSIHPTAFVAPSADVIGQVVLLEYSSVWYHATLRGDINTITLGAYSNIQDNCVVHLADDYGVTIGSYVTIGHSAIIHACTIEDEVLVGMGACIMDGAHIGTGSIIGAQALVTARTIIPPGSLVLGSPARVIQALDAKRQSSIAHWAKKYVKVAASFNAPSSSHS